MLYLETYYVKSRNICDWISLSRFSGLGTFSGLRTFQAQVTDRIYKTSKWNRLHWMEKGNSKYVIKVQFKKTKIVLVKEKWCDSDVIRLVTLGTLTRHSYCSTLFSLYSSEFYHHCWRTEEPVLIRFCDLRNLVLEALWNE